MSEGSERFGTEGPPFPCPSCGFEVFSEPPGSYEMCPICSWEDDQVQLRFPAWGGGANGISLAEHQQLALASYPLATMVLDSYQRSKRWRPLTDEEILAARSLQAQAPKSPLEYFYQAADEKFPQYYWLSDTSSFSE